MKALAIIVLMIPLVLLAACTLTTRYTYTCEGKCSGEIGRDLDANTPEQIKALSQPTKKDPSWTP